MHKLVLFDNPMELRRIRKEDGDRLVPFCQRAVHREIRPAINATHLKDTSGTNVLIIQLYPRGLWRLASNEYAIQDETYYSKLTELPLRVLLTKLRLGLL